MSYSDYGAGPYGPPPRSHPNGTVILVLGIISLVGCLLTGPFAWAMGNKALREIDESGYYYENRGMVQAGRICGIVGTALLIVTFCFTALGVTLAIIGAANSS
ncbi:unnamed protein product [[Actinomadura] parvosata subsp. kistnae]|uniref:DUF4190 domain-containing protein n=1 Tax=[Actinomadura] parvosata subsp. kistnae TaxID=1909395 RepID=A0A1V0A2J2_9ACTN|nr:DUF4190 domain-containing protein [Nonomuraea sp. ATCC 55076]AQZ64441.1 hypothetical protein BKM31_25925 [Nonomuraea sp. ATCC 55076]SPL89238.1 unnamed protein product [Actinomadura parvosata subsp. kistnae]